MSSQRGDQKVAEEDGGQSEWQSAETDDAGHISAVPVRHLKGLITERQCQWLGVRSQNLLRVTVDQFAVKA